MAIAVVGQLLYAFIHTYIHVGMHIYLAVKLIKHNLFTSAYQTGVYGSPGEHQ